MRLTLILINLKFNRFQKYFIMIAGLLIFSDTYIPGEDKLFLQLGEKLGEPL